MIKILGTVTEVISTLVEYLVRMLTVILADDDTILTKSVYRYSMQSRQL